MAEIYKEHWYQVDFKKAAYYTESAGFTQIPYDLFDFETRIYSHLQSKLKFKLRQGTGDKIEFYMSPYYKDVPTTFEEFEKKWEEFNGKQGKVDSVKEF